MKSEEDLGLFPLFLLLEGITLCPGGSARWRDGGQREDHTYTHGADRWEILELEEEVGGQGEGLLSNHFLFELVGQMLSLLEPLPLLGRRLLVAREQNGEEMEVTSKEKSDRKIEEKSKVWTQLVLLHLNYFPH